jgi:hypothetical protein
LHGPASDFKTYASRSERQGILVREHPAIGTQCWCNPMSAIGTKRTCHSR